ncbi:hypothetical protein VPHD85_0060 [Vibrio phage D85]
MIITYNCLCKYDPLLLSLGRATDYKPDLIVGLFL